MNTTTSCKRNQSSSLVKILRTVSLGLCLSLGVASNSLAANYQLDTVAADLDFPWSIDFLPNGDILVTELSGSLRRISADGSVSDPIANVPEVFRASQGGLFDVLVDPDFADNQRVFLSYAKGDAQSNGTVVASAYLEGDTLSNVKEIFTAAPDKYAPLHYGGRIAWLPDGTLLLTTGDGFDFREQAQNLATHFGKMIRMNPDGSAPADNPFPEYPFVFSYGHRNPQGLAVAQDGTIYEHEHGPRGGDEVNIIKPGQNYGWPITTHGLDYNGAYVSPFKEREGIESAAHIWVPSIAPSGLAVYEGDAFAAWRGNLFVGALVNNDVRRLTLAGNTVIAEEILFAELDQRIRDIRVSPDGLLYIITDGAQGQVVRVSPK